MLVLNSVAQTVIETVRGAHDAYVFVYQRRKKNGSPDEGQPHRVDTMNKVACRRVREQDGLGDLHVHALRRWLSSCTPRWKHSVKTTDAGTSQLRC